MDLRALVDAYRREKASPALQSLPDNFYEDLSRYLEERKREMSERARELSPDLLREIRELEEERGMVKELVEKRLEKIMTRVIRSLKLGKEDETNLVGWEKEFYKDLLARCREIVDMYVPEVTLPRGSAIKMTHVHILKEIPQFVGMDLRKYGPYYPGQRVVLPEEVAKVLVSRKLAEVVE